MNSKTSKNYKRRWNRGRRTGRRGRSVFRKLPRFNCALCQEPIDDIRSALSEPNEGLPVHFRCALELVTNMLTPTDNEIVIYLGKGSFAVVDQREYNKRRLKIHRRLDWEHEDERSEWRRDLQAIT